MVQGLMDRDPCVFSTSQLHFSNYGRDHTIQHTKRSYRSAQVPLATFILFGGFIAQYIVGHIYLLKSSNLQLRQNATSTTR